MSDSVGEDHESEADAQDHGQHDSRSPSMLTPPLEEESCENAGRRQYQKSIAREREVGGQKAAKGRNQKQDSGPAACRKSEGGEDAGKQNGCVSEQNRMHRSMRPVDSGAYLAQGHSSRSDGSEAEDYAD